MRRCTLSIGVLAVVGATVVACDKTPQECQALNQALKANETALKESKTADYKAEPKKSAELARAYATAVEGEIKALKSLEPTNTRLARYSEDLRGSLTEAKDAAQKLALAYDAMVPSTDASCSAETAWAESMSPIKKLCKKEDPTCAQIQLLPEPGTGDRSLAEELESYATRLEAIRVDDAKLKELVTGRINRARDYAAAQRESSVQAGKVDAISGTYFRAIAKGGPALRDIEQECKR